MCEPSVLDVEGALKFHRRTSRACRWVQGILRKISPSCLRRLMTEILADEIPLSL
jgi:hypothetical protein